MAANSINDFYVETILALFRYTLPSTILALVQPTVNIGVGFRLMEGIGEA